MWTRNNGKTKYKGSYARYHGGERFFVLQKENPKKNDNAKVYESWQAAVKDKWRKV